MPEIESTPEAASRLYRRMAANLEIVRERLGRPLTLTDKLLLGHLDDPADAPFGTGHGDLLLRPDRVVFQDVLGQTGMLQFMQTGRRRVAVPTTIHCDHLVQARVTGESDLRDSLVENREVYDFLRSAAARYGAGFWEPGAGIIHQVVLEHYAYPGTLIVGTDSHTPNAAGLGALAVGVGGADAVEVIAGLPWELRNPRRIGVVLTGRLDGWAAPKDVILWLAGQLGTAGGTHAIIEYLGPGARNLSATGKATIGNMGAELGATTSLFPVDAAMLRYLRATGRRRLSAVVERHRGLLAADAEVEARPERHFDRVLELDLSRLEPHVVGPHTPDRARPLSALAAEVDDSGNGFIDTISTALIGSCTNSSYEDMSRAADVAAQARSRGLAADVPFMVTPGSAGIRATVERDGQLDALREIGATVLANACGPCIGQWRRNDPERAPDEGRPNTIVTSYNRNFPGRNDGHAATMSFIASPEVVTALALAGRLSFDPRRDPLVGSDGASFRLDPPRTAPDVPDSFAPVASLYQAPPLDGSAIEVRIDPASERLQRLDPWPAWDGRDLLDLEILVKAEGKTTTDQISPAGFWLRYRGHLDRFSDNLLLGARNAFTGEVGRARGETLATVARRYRAAGRGWVVVGDDNYGEGSSREHAALSPRLLGGVAVIARSFARIHETNLKKQGLLALTFRDPQDFERIREGDRLNLVDLAALAPGREVACEVRHDDGSRERLALAHSFSEAQLAWFRAGSALNTLPRPTQGPVGPRGEEAARSA